MAKFLNTDAKRAFKMIKMTNEQIKVLKNAYKQVETVKSTVANSALYVIDQANSHVQGNEILGIKIDDGEAEVKKMSKEEAKHEGLMRVKVIDPKELVFKEQSKDEESTEVSLVTLTSYKLFRVTGLNRLKLDMKIFSFFN